MTVVALNPGLLVGVQAPGIVDSVAPVDQESTDAYVAVVGSELDARAFGALSYTILNTDGVNSIDWKVQGSNDVAFTTTVDVKVEAGVAAGASDTYAVSPPPYSYYRVVIKATVGASQGDASVRGIAK